MIYRPMDDHVVCCMLNRFERESFHQLWQELGEAYRSNPPDQAAIDDASQRYKSEGRRAIDLALKWGLGIDFTSDGGCY